MIFPFFLLASKTDKLLGGDTFQNQSVKLICGQAFSFIIIRFLNCVFLYISPFKMKLMPSNDEFR